MAMILVVDDRAVNREFLCVLMGYAGHSVVEATDGGAALEMTRKLRPDLIISDIVMPTMSGLDFARQLRADPEIAGIPIIFYTASYRLGDARKLAEECGVSAVISKPSKPKIILDAVAAALGLPAASVLKPPVLAQSMPLNGEAMTLSLRLSMLIELGLELSAQSNPQQLLDLVCRAAREIFSADYAAAAIVDPVAGGLRHFSTQGFTGETGAWVTSLDTGAGLLGTLLKEGKPCRRQGLAGKADSEMPAGHPPIDTLLVVPMNSSVRCYGWFYVANRLGSAIFSETDEEIAITLAAKLTLAYGNLLLNNTLQDYASRLVADSEAIKQLNAGLEREVQARQNSETRFRLAMEVQSSMAYTLNPALRYTWAHSSLTDFDEQAVLGKSEFDLRTEETANRLTALYRQVIETGAGLRQDVFVTSAAQPLMPRYFDLVVEPLKRADGEVLGVICVANDITERKHVEAELRAAKAEAERANNAKSRFLAAASHDLRQPLSALSLYVNLLKGKLSPSGQPMLANMKDCICSLSELLSDLLDLSKLEAGAVAPTVRDFSVAETLDSLASLHAPETQLKGLSLRFVASRLTGRTDPVLFRRILGNLVSNAIRYTEHGGVLVGCRRRLGKIWVEVWDTGIGIAEEQTHEIFEEFRQLGDDARNRGSGLGLAIVARTAALLGLEISVRSRPDHGSVFAIELPLGQAGVSRALELAEAGQRPLRIALVDDNAMVREALGFALEDAGHQVLAAATGAAILAEIDSRPPDIVISDYRLAGGETGFDVISGLRAACGADLAAILITGDTDPKLMRSMADRGIVVLHKPLDMKALVNYLEVLTCPAQAVLR